MPPIFFEYYELDDHSAFWISESAHYSNLSVKIFWTEGRMVSWHEKHLKAVQSKSMKRLTVSFSFQWSWAVIHVSCPNQGWEALRRLRKILVYKFELKCAFQWDGSSFSFCATQCTFRALVASNIQFVQRSNAVYILTELQMFFWLPCWAKVLVHLSVWYFRHCLVPCYLATLLCLMVRWRMWTHGMHQCCGNCLGMNISVQWEERERRGQLEMLLQFCLTTLSKECKKR